jgi:ribosome maturation factor RimP
MKATHLDRMIGHYCKIVMKEPGDTKAHVVTGTIQEIEHQTRLLIVKSYSGCYCLSIDAIVAIKPKKMNYS